MQLIFGDDTKIVKKFATVDVKMVREMNKGLTRKKKIYSSIKIKKGIRTPEFEELLTGCFTSAAN